MSDKIKKIFLALCVIVPFLIYCVVYYAGVFKRAPYKFTEFKSFEFQYGTKDSLVNKYNSVTGEYQYLDKRDSLVKLKMFLKKSELLYLHRKAADLGFWDFPSDERTYDTSRINGQKPARYIIEFGYLRKNKKVIYDANYGGPQRLIDADKQMITEIQKVLAEAETRLKK
ncbi:MAG TPA: hypothetical protein VGN20_05435 [Mucilaginibacter sp.]|jgi:hypothetical protein